MTPTRPAWPGEFRPASGADDERCDVRGARAPGPRLGRRLGSARSREHQRPAGLHGGGLPGR